MIRLLIADDEKLERDALTEMVARRFDEHQVVLETAENGRKAADTAILWGADLILMDIEMPGMSGLDAARAVLAQRPGCRVIFVTAYSLFQYAHEAVHLGACDYLLKPVDPSQLRALFERLAADLDGGVLFPPAEIPAAEPLSNEAEKVRRSRRFLSDNPWPATMLVMYPIRDSIERGVVAVEINLRALGRLLDMRAYKAFDKPFIICYERESGRLVYSYEYYY